VNRFRRPVTHRKDKRVLKIFLSSVSILESSVEVHNSSIKCIKLQHGGLLEIHHMFQKEAVELHGPLRHRHCRDITEIK
jgi:hypothetical protein